MQYCGIFFIIVCLPLWSFAGLKPDADSRNVSVSLDAENATAHFSLQNNGSAQIEIIKTATSCSCTSLILDKRAIAIGESVNIVANIDTRIIAGSKDVSILIFTDDTKAATILKVHVRVPDIVATSPQSLSWNIGEDPSPKIINVAISDHINGGIVKVDSSSNSIIASMLQKEDGSFAVSLKPPGTMVSFVGTTTLSISAFATVNGKQIIKTQSINVLVSVNPSAEATSRPNR